MTRAIPNPEKEKKISIRLKFGERKQPKEQKRKLTIPNSSNVLCLIRVLRTPKIMAEVTATICDNVNICPTTPTGYPNVSPMSMRSNPAIRLGK